MANVCAEHNDEGFCFRFIFGFSLFLIYFWSNGFFLQHCTTKPLELCGAYQRREAIVPTEDNRQPSWMNWRQKTSRAISWDKRRAKYGFTSNLIFCWCLRLKKIEREVILLFFLFLFTYLFIYLRRTHSERRRSAPNKMPFYRNDIFFTLFAW